MALLQTHRWQLFVDESGDFSRTEDAASADRSSRPEDVVVSGILLRQGDPRLNDLALREAMRRALPHIPWPFHAAHMNQTLSPLLWHLIGSKDPSICQPLEGNEAQQCQDALALFGLPQRQHIQQMAHDYVASRRLPELGPLRSYSFLLTRHDRFERFFRKRIQEDRVALRSLIQRAGELLHPDDNGYCDAYMVTCGEEFASASASAIPERYLCLLRGVLERVVDALLHFPGHHNVELYIQHRHAREDETATSLYQGDILELVKAISLSSHLTIDFSPPIHVTLRAKKAYATTHAMPDAEVVLKPWGIDAYSEDIGGGYVLADLAANCTRQVFRRGVGPAPSTGLRQIEREIAQVFPLSNRFFARHGSLLSAAPSCLATLQEARTEGMARDAVEATLTALPNAHRCRLWALQQVLDWCPNNPQGDAPQ